MTSGIMTKDSEWATFIRARFFPNNSMIAYYRSSSIWPCLKHNWSIIALHSSWLIGDGKYINFWNDRWCHSIDGSITDLLRLDQNTRLLLKAKLPTSSQMTLRVFQAT
ncbi:hypothetical protein BVC80_8705g10 [Macleaya cordata]|uniref:Reverse transcriptase zinc-binding domain n=1 Tax=Macleaya cordata TaxID=56857 RepID=A0A200QDX8_MACCD|nr:hypothetical protein BVC80_8705g10 [Macleaya cordata]